MARYAAQIFFSAGDGDGGGGVCSGGDGAGAFGRGGASAHRTMHTPPQYSTRVLKACTTHM